jgi:hypothetical protein
MWHQIWTVDTNPAGLKRLPMRGQNCNAGTSRATRESSYNDERQQSATPAQQGPGGAARPPLQPATPAQGATTQVICEKQEHCGCKAK